MNKTAIFYSFHTNKTSKVAEKIIQEFGKEKLEIENAEAVTEKKFMAYDNYIIGVATWWDGELPNYWDEFVPAIEDLDLTGKVFAIFGLGDQKKYSENFNDGVGIFAELIKNRGGKIIGFTSAKEYKFEDSKALYKKNEFYGLCLDEENQHKLTDSRIKKWVSDIKKEFQF